MILLQAHNVARYFGSDRLFSNISLNIRDKDKLALVGRNGSGKSTLLKILAGEEKSDEGQVSLAKDIQIGYLAQRTGIISDASIWEEMVAVFEDVMEMERDMHRLEEKLSQVDPLENEQTYSDILKHYDQVQHNFKEANGYGYQNEIKSVLAGFHFHEDLYDTPIQDLSGGQKTRLALAKLLLEKPDILILDEPTNHLDMDTLSWLEGYLKGYSGALLIVSHDRYFLDELVSEVYDLSHGQLYHYMGNYSKYLKEKDKRLEKQWKDYEKQQKEIQKLEDFVQKNITRASTSKRAQARQKQLDRMDRLEKPKSDQRSVRMPFHPNQVSGDLVLQVKNLAIGYEGQVTAEGIDFEQRRQEIIAIVGPNGVGKSTLLKTIVGLIPPIEGEIITGTKVDIGYYDQEQEELSPSKTILNELWDDHPLLNEGDIRSILGSFLFSGDDVLKSIHSLSGGEKARVALAKLSLQHDNFLILDEPTNHLDIDSKEVLEEALLNFEGSILFVSHDRYFINRLASKVIEISEEESTLYLGNYDYYLKKKKELEEIALLLEEEELDETDLPEKSDIKTKANHNLDRQELKDLQRDQRRLEREIQAIEKEIEEKEEESQVISEALLQPEIYQDPIKAQDLGEDLKQLQEELESLTEDWEVTVLELEDLLS